MPVQILFYIVPLVLIALLTVWLTGSKEKPTHAGGIVYKRDGDHTLFLIVSSLSEKGKWVFPKGHIEKGENAEFAAVREVQEEAGVHARLIKKAGTISYTKKGKQYRAVYFVMEFLGIKGQGIENREVLWLERDEALERLGSGKRAGLLKRIAF